MAGNKGSGLFFGFLAGGIIGAVVALLYAPKSGREFRKDIKEKTDGYLDDVEKYMAEAREKAKNLINEGKKKSEKIIDEAKVKSEEILKDAEKLLKDAKVKTGEALHSSKGILDSESGKIKSAVKAGVDAYKETKKSSKS